MSLKIGITGGIGSGKSYVAKVFKALGVPFYDADSAAKEIMVSSAQVREALVARFGPEVYFADGQLNRPFLSALVFKDADKLAQLNAIVHPAVIQHGLDWADRQEGPYSLKEAALLFESGSYKTLDYTILVTAPEDLRVQRVMSRDKISAEQVLDRMAKQLPDTDKMQLADFVINNDESDPLLPQVLALHYKFLEEYK